VGITWDYSSLTPYTQAIEQVMAPNSSGYIFTPLSFQNSLDRAEPVSDTLYIGSIELSNSYNFFDLTSTQYKQVARASQIEGVDMKTKYDSSDVVYQFPMQYGNAKDSSTSGYTISLAYKLYYIHSQKRVNEIEGEGTLITPYGTFSALKLKSTIYATDSFSIDTFGIPQYSYQTIEYKWFNPTYGYPLLEVKKEIISGVTISTKARYLDSIRYFTPAALFLYYPETPVQGESLTFQNLSSNATNYYWDFGDGNTSTSVNPSYTYTDTGSYMITLIAFNPTSADTFSLPIFVTDSNAIISYFTYSPQYPCYGVDTIAFYNTSYNATSYLWDFGDGNTSTDEDPSYAYANPGNYTVKLIAYNNSSSDTMSVQVKFANMPLASFTTLDSVVTSPVIFTNTSTGVDNATTYYWDFGFGASPSTSTNESPLVTYSFIGDKTVYLIAYNSAGCSSTFVTSIHVSAIDTGIVSYFTVSPEEPCFGDSVYFKNESYNANSYVWHFGDGVTSAEENPAYAYASPGLYTVKLIASKGLSSDTSMQQLYFASMPTAFFSIDSTVIHLVGDPITITNNSVGTDSLTTFYWDFGTNANPSFSTDESPTVAYNTTGIKKITLTVYNSKGCYSTYSDSILIDDFFIGINAASVDDELFIYEGNSKEIFVLYSAVEKSTVECRVFNLIGEKLYSGQYKMAKGKNQIRVPFNGRGIYVLQLTTSSGKTVGKKFSKMN
jgi:PKD repeat protein